MQYLEVSKDTTLSKLASVVGERNVDSVLNANGLTRAVNIGKAFIERNKKTVSEFGEVDYQTKLNILNQFVGDSDLYEKAALGTESEWILLSVHTCFGDAIRIPIEIKLPPFVGVLGNGERVSRKVYQDCTDSLLKPEYHKVDPAVFSEYSSTYAHGSYSVTENGQIRKGEVYQWFKIPWGEVFLYSYLGDEQLFFPVYPDGFDDGVRANFDEMPEMLYQYEPWNVYKSSGPREVSFTFEFHRDMWTGDHRDGCANNLIRGCEANCYPDYNGSLVNPPLVSLYIHGRNFITGIMTDCKVNWDKPIGLDGFYLMCKLSFTIKEVSQEALNFRTVRNKGLIS